jgi:ribosomal protein S12 methylthiotransferase
MPGQIEESIKQERLDALMNYAAQITSFKLKDYLGQIMPVLVIDSAHEIYGEGWFAGRSQYQAPEVDGVIYFSSKKTRIGEIVMVKITGNEIYDLIGEEI